MVTEATRAREASKYAGYLYVPWARPHSIVMDR